MQAAETIQGKAYDIKTAYCDAVCTLYKGEYGNGRIALQLIDIDDEPQMTASVNLVDAPCPEGHTWIKTWSENEGILQELIRHGIVEPASLDAKNDFGCQATLVKVLV
jgi:hypothetical protein